MVLEYSREFLGVFIGDFLIRTPNIANDMFCKRGESNTTHGTCRNKPYNYALITLLPLCCALIEGIMLTLRAINKLPQA
jgi:hypothetical protein